MIEHEPNQVTSERSQRVVVDGYLFSIEIYRLETDKTCTLEVVDHEGSSHVRDGQFRSGKDARNSALKALEAEVQSPSCAATTSSLDHGAASDDYTMPVGSGFRQLCGPDLCAPPPC